MEPEELDDRLVKVTMSGGGGNGDDGVDGGENDVNGGDNVVNNGDNDGDNGVNDGDNGANNGGDNNGDNGVDNGEDEDEECTSCLQIEFLMDMKVKPSAFTLANCDNGNCFINGNFEASNNGIAWAILKTTISDDDDSNKCWNVECDMFFKYFRIIGEGTNKVTLKNFELFGSLEMEYNQGNIPTTLVI